jgi:hypothetical protein
MVWLFLLFLVYSNQAFAVGWLKSDKAIGYCCTNGQGEVILDSHGYPISVNSNGSNTVIQKRHPNTGNVVWSYPLGRSRRGEMSMSRSIAMDGNGNIIVAGSIGHFNPISPSRGIVVKLDGNSGQLLWRWYTSFGVQASGVDAVFYDLLTDGHGDVYAFGTHWDQQSKNDQYAVRIDGSQGTTVWEYIANGGSTDEAVNTSWPNIPLQENFVEAAFDLSGNILVAGTIKDPIDENWHVTVKRIDKSTGQENWGFIYSSGSGRAERATAMELMANGSVSVAGGSAYIGGYVFNMIPGNGGVHWTTYDPMSYPYRIFHDLAKAQNGDIIVGGVQDDYEKYLARIDGSTGSSVWSTSFFGAANSYGGIFGVSVGNDGHIYVVGNAGNSPYAAGNMYLAKINGVGSTLWETLVAPAEDSAQRARLFDVVVDPSASQLFAIGNQFPSPNAVPVGSWTHALGLSTQDGQLSSDKVKEEMIFLIPIWDNWLLWLVPVDDIKQIEAAGQSLSLQGELYKFKAADDLSDLDSQPETPLYLTADKEGELIKALDNARDKFVKRSAPAVVYVQRDSKAFNLANKLWSLEGFTMESVESSKAR